MKMQMSLGPPFSSSSCSFALLPLRRAIGRHRHNSLRSAYKVAFLAAALMLIHDLGDGCGFVLDLGTVAPGVNAGPTLGRVSPSLEHCLALAACILFLD
jgi:hypothetical protein